MKKIIPVLSVVTPFIAFAAPVSDIGGLIDVISDLFSKVIPLLMIVATVLFLWGILRFITAGGEEEEIKEGKSYIIYGLIGLFIMSSVWGLVGILKGTFGTTGSNVIEKGPTIPK